MYIADAWAKAKEILHRHYIVFRQFKLLFVEISQEFRELFLRNRYLIPLLFYPFADSINF